MCSPLSCGTSNFPKKEEYDMEELLYAPSKKIKDSGKNPYTNRGLDKFNALLAELEAKKQQIYTRKGSQDISYIRFEYSSSTSEWKPIVVVKTKGKGIKSDKYKRINVVKKEIDDQVIIQENKERGILSKNPQSKSSIKPWRFSFKMENISQPSCYVSMMFMLILLLLTISGRTFGILCATIGWYLLPLIKDKSSSLSLNSSTSTNIGLKKINEGYSEKLSERNIIITKSGSMASPNNVLLNNGLEDKSPAAKHAHRKSW